MPGIQLSGLVSGMDTEGMIAQLMAIERQPRTRLTFQQAAAKARQEALQQIDTKLDSLRTAAADLSSVLAWAPKQTATFSDPTKATATITGGVGPGTYSLVVSRLATAEQRTYSFVPKNSAHTLTVNGTAMALSANESLDSVVTRLNNDATYGVYAVNSGGNLVLASRTTGTAITASSTGGIISEQAALAKPAQTASFSIDGTSYTSPTNTISSSSGATGFIMGMSIDLKGTTTGMTVEVSPLKVDKEAVKTRLKAFVDAYNTAMDAMRSSVSEKSVKDAKTELDARKGVLFGDMGLRTIMDQMRNTVMNPLSVGNDNTLDELADLGISTGAVTGAGAYSQDAVNGKLTLDTAKLEAALDRDPTGVQRLLGGITGTSGFSQAFTGAIDPYAQSGGLLAGRAESAGSTITRLDDALKRMDDRLSRREESLRKMFANLEIALQRSQSQSADLLARLGSLSNSG